MPVANRPLAVAFESLRRLRPRQGDSCCVAVLVALLGLALACGNPPDDAVAGPRPVSAPAASSAPVAADTADAAPGALGGLRGQIVIDGSSTVFPITEAVAGEVEELAPELMVRLGVSGTGGGFRKFCRAELDIADASRPIKGAERAVCEAAGIDFVELPIAFDGLSVVVHAGNDFARCMTLGELRTVWGPAAEGAITRWSQVRAGWPDAPLGLYGAGRDSGTFDYFTSAVVGAEGSSRADFVASEDDYLIAQDVAGDPNGLGFFGLAYMREYRDVLRPVAIDAGDGCVAPTDTTISSGTYRPLSRPIFLYVRLASLERPEVEAFLAHYLRVAPRVVPGVGYVPLPKRAYELARQRLASRRTGSVFEDGSEVGVSIESLLALESGAGR